MDRSKLPYRKNCEGYFLCSNGRVVVRNTGKGYLEFPGGGVEEGEDPGKALLREAFEEAGVVIDGELEKIGMIHFDWSPEWAKTEKQKMRYSRFRGEEMYFYVGKVKELVTPEGDSYEQGWEGDITMDLDEAIALIKEDKALGMEEYKEMQIRVLESFKR